MNKTKVSGGQKNKMPCYLPIYNDLYEQIVSGELRNGDLMPSENELTKRYNVSRNSVRQALTILKEDGLILKHQGKGSIVSYNEMKTSNQKTIFNPMVECANCEVDSVELTYNFNPPTRIAMDRLNLKPTDILLAANLVYKSGVHIIGHTFLQIPMTVFKDQEIDLNSLDDISDFINNTIYDIAKSSEMSIKLTETHENINTFLSLDTNQPIIYLESILKDSNHQCIGRFKYYLIDQHYDLTFVFQ